MLCICMFFCGCMTTTSSITSSQPTTPSATQLTTQSTIPSLLQPTTQSFINVQRKDNSEPLKIGTIVHYSGTQTIFRVEQVLNNESFELGQSAWAGAKYIPTDRIIKNIRHIFTIAEIKYTFQYSSFSYIIIP